MHIARSLLVTGLALSSMCADAALQFTDWTTANAGTIGTLNVSLTGTFVQGVVLNGTSTIFNSSNFTPSLPLSDWIEIQGRSPAASYVITFSQQVVDPVIHLSSLASTLTFAGASPVKVSGQASFLVSGNTVSGSPSGSGDSNGTIRVPGVFSSLSFTSFFSQASGDGIAIQIGVDPLLPVPEPRSAVLIALGLSAVALWVRRRRS